VTEKFNFYNRLGEVNERVNGRLEEATKYYEMAYSIGVGDRQIDVPLSVELNILTALVFILNQIGNHDRALLYN
jgi:hypothetical protein